MTVIILITVIASGSIYLNVRANDQDQKARQAELKKVEKQQELEAAAKKEKEELVAVPKTTAVSPSVVSSGGDKVQTSIPIVDSTTKDFIHYKAGTPLADPLSLGIGKAITSLSETDIIRLQNYEQYSTAGGQKSGNYISFQDMYTNDRLNCDGMLNRFTPIGLAQYSGAKVEWITSPKLLYTNAVHQYCLRGILRLTYSNNENKFELVANQSYQCDVEYNISCTYNASEYFTSVEGISYLSKFRAAN
jgi:hypothetical protein